MKNALLGRKKEEKNGFGSGVCEGMIETFGNYAAW